LIRDVRPATRCNQPFFTTVYDDAQTLLQSGANLALARATLDGHIQHLQELQPILQKEIRGADLICQEEDLECATADKRLATLQQQIDKKKAELSSKETDIGGLITSLAVIATAVASIATGGMAAVAVIPELLALPGKLNGSDIVSLMGKSGEATREKLKKDAGGLKDIVQGGTAVISLFKAIDDLGRAPIPKEDAEYRQLLRELIDAVAQQKLSRLHQSQAALAKETAVARADLNTADIARAQTQSRTLTSELSSLANAAMTLIRSAQDAWTW
jgi:hypothetical protein